jgi:peptidoglycan hydrolase-like protein with peptidoglycan-binding domain
MKRLLLTTAAAIALAFGGAGLSYAQGAGGHTGTEHNASSGMSQEHVKQAQQKLQSEGLYHGQIDGIDGPETKQALEQFQQKHGLKQTGSLDQETMAALMGNQTSGSGSSMPPSSGNEGNGSSRQQPQHLGSSGGSEGNAGSSNQQK